MEVSEIKELLTQYNLIIEKLRDAGIIRTSKIVADYGEYLTGKALNLRLANVNNNKSYDATDNFGKTYQVKTRKATSWNTPKVFPADKSKLDNVDYLICVELDKDWNLVELLKIPTNEVNTNNYNRIVINKKLKEKYSILNSIEFR